MELGWGTAALALGWDAFEGLLEGAAEMEPPLPVRRAGGQRAAASLAFVDRFYMEERGAQTRGVFAYDERLRLLPF